MGVSGDLGDVLEAEMLKRGMMFEVIDWHDGQEPLPFG
jgi:hypothetical protein